MKAFILTIFIVFECYFISWAFWTIFDLKLKNKEKKKKVDYLKISSCLNSCNTIEQLSSADNMITNFRKKYKSDNLYGLLISRYVFLKHKIQGD